MTYLLLGWFWNSWIQSDILAGKASPNLQAMSSGLTIPPTLKFKSLSKLRTLITEGIVKKSEIAVEKWGFVYNYCGKLHCRTFGHYVAVNCESEVASCHSWEFLIFAFRQDCAYTHFTYLLFLSQRNHCCVVFTIISCFFQKMLYSLFKQFQIFINLIITFITSAFVFPGAKKNT